MKKSIIIILLLSLNHFVFTLDLEVIITNHPKYQSELKKAEITKSQLLISDLKKYPLFGTVSTSTYGQISDPSFNYTIGTSIGYDFLDNQSDKEMEIARLELELTNLQLKQVYRDLKYQMLFLLLQYIHSNEYYTHIVNSYNSIESYTVKVNARYRGGDLSKSEKLYADSVLLKNSVKVVDAEYLVAEAKSNFEHFSYSTMPENITTADLKIDLSGEQSSLEEEFSRWEIKSLEVEKKYSSTYSHPSLKLSASVKFPFDYSSSWQLGLSMNYPLAGRKIDKLKEREYTDLIENQGDILNTLISSREMDLEHITERMKHLRLKKELYISSLEISRESMDGVLLESNAGVRTVFDVISAKNSITDTEQLILETEQELELMELELYKLKGFYE